MLFRGITVFSVILSAFFTALSGGFADFRFLWMLPVVFAGAFVVLFLAVLLYFVVIILAVNKKVPQEHDSPFYRRLASQLIDFLIPLFRVRIHPQNADKIPTDRRFLLVCNHISSADPLVLLHCFPNSQLGFISKQEVQDFFLVGKLQHKLMCQPINRENDREALKTILRCIKLLKNDEISIGVFPEGYTSLDGKLHRFRSGVFKIAQKAEVPIVVCTLKNTNRIYHGNIQHLKATDVPMHLVDVITPEQYRGMTTVEIADMVYEMMISDLGEAFRGTEG